MDSIFKEYPSSMTVSTEATVLSCIIYAKEERGVAVIYTPNMFIQTKYENENEMVFINIIGVLVDLLLMIDP